MSSLYRRWIESWERELALFDGTRKTGPFEWGRDWLADLAPDIPRGQCSASQIQKALSESKAVFSYHRPADYEYENTTARLRFTSALESPFPENNQVRARFFRVERDLGRAVVLIPQWNADADSQVGFCRLINRFGISVLRMSAAYHEHRKPAGLERADYHVSSNIGRTIHAMRQSVIDVRSCLDWLQQRGYDRLAVLGVSLGSCIAFLAAAHDPRVKAGVFNHVSMHFGDAVWTGLATRHVRASIEGNLSREQLRRLWALVSPATYVDCFSGRDFEGQVVWTNYDPVFLPSYSRQFVTACRRAGVSMAALGLPCGHYTLGKFPFNWIDGLTVCRFLHRNL